MNAKNPDNPITQLQPQQVWHYFHQLNQIPRPSYHEEQIQQYMLEFGQSLGLQTSRDEVGNIIIKKPATQGMENRKGVILQSHLDMVAQANKDTLHDFTTDPIQTLIKTTDTGDWVTANGTTLGADNGMGVAAIMAVLASKDIAHGDIEALFTSTEETGMVGAFGLQAGLLDGEILLNLDSEDEGELYVGCAGGVDATCQIPITYEAMPEDMSVYKVTLKSLRGGHSGLNIIDQRGNANKLLARWLVEVDKDLKQMPVRLISFNGGNLRNAIPREGELIIATGQYESVATHLNHYLATLNKEYQGIEQNIELTIEPVANDANACPQSTCLTINSHNKVINAINATPNGIYRMSNDMAGLVETSCNIGIVATHQQPVAVNNVEENTAEENIVEVNILLRSSLDSAKQQLANEIRSLYALIDVQTQFDGDYPGWNPNPNSQILQIMKQTGKQVFGDTPEIKGIHAGLECGILGINYPHWDMISFGPTIRGAHSPDERVQIESVASFYEWLLATLKQIPEKEAILG